MKWFRWTITNEALCGVSFLISVSLLVAGVYVLAGLGWSLIAAAVPALGLSALIARGLARA